jgi:hypothetical protein
MNADGTIKYRPVSPCSYPYNDTRDRTSWTARCDTTVYSEVLLLAMAAGLQHGPSVAFACDLAKSFEWINRQRDKVHTNCLVWERDGTLSTFTHLYSCSENLARPESHTTPSNSSLEKCVVDSAWHYHFRPSSSETATTSLELSRSRTRTDSPKRSV